MGKNPFQHVDLRVTDMRVATGFYAKLLPPLGFKRDESSEAWTVFTAAGRPPDQPWFAFTEDKNHRPCANRIAFSAASPEEVDRLAAIAVEAGAKKMSGPRACPEYSASYYAAFFEDPCGNKLEICYVAE
jgi:predicted lactoylglutathione lyase